MTLTLETDTIPIKINPEGVALVGGTRVTLDTVAAAFKEGATAEEIVYRYPSLQLADVYMVISYYLRHWDQVENYLHVRQEISEKIRCQNQKRFDPLGARERLLARHSKTG